MCRSIDVNRLKNSGVLVEGWSGGWNWTRDGEQVASIGIRGGRGRIALTYRWKQSGTDWQDVVESIRIHWRPCRFGGERPFFECPGVINALACNRIALKLYSASRYYLCRKCYRLTYASCNEDRCDRALRRANHIRVRLGGELGYDALLPQRPKGMWRKTYDNLSEAVFAHESVAEARLARMAALIMELDQTPSVRKGKGKKGYWR